MAGRSSNRKVVPECKEALDAMKYEIAAELGLMNSISNSGADTEFAGELGTSTGGSRGSIHWESLATRDAGAVGGTITRRLIEQAQRTLGNL